MDDVDLPLPPLTLRRLIAVAIALVVVLVFALRHFGGGRAPAVPSVAPVRVAKPAPVKELVVDVAGAVRRPGLYHLRDGTRIADALAAAGGATAKAQVDLVNLAAPLADGEQVVVPRRAAAGAAAAASPPSAAASPAAPLDLNSATVDQLETLPGVGPATAQKIVDYRTAHGPFHAVDELDGVSGIGPAKLAELRGLVIP
jgi:competence protein ComEA